jgi:hypothetical protein
MVEMVVKDSFKDNPPLIEAISLTELTPSHLLGLLLFVRQDLFSQLMERQ